MKYILFTFDGFGLPIAEHLIREGFEVLVGLVTDDKTLFIQSEIQNYTKEDPVDKEKRLRMHKNIINSLPAELLLQKLMKIQNKDDYFVFFDDNYLFYYADRVNQMGFRHGNFPTEEDRRFEVDRDFANDFVSRWYPDIQLTEKKLFSSIDSAIEFLKTSNDIWVIKGKDKFAKTFVPYTNDSQIAKKQLIDMLFSFQDNYEKAGFILEKKVSDVIEITPEKAYYDGEPVSLVLNFENKYIGSGNISYQTLCAEDLVFPISMQNKIHNIAFPPIVDKLAKKHKGLFFWDASLLINKKTGNIYFGEFCPNRPGYNSFFTYMSQLPSVSHFFESVIAKKNPFTLGTVGVSVSMYNLYKDASGAPLGDLGVIIPESVRSHVWATDVYKKDSREELKTLGFDSFFCTVTGSGETIYKSVDAVYKSIEKIGLPGAYFRPKFDFVSKTYPTSILNRITYGISHGLFQIPFSIR